MKVDKNVMRGVNRSNILRCILQEGSINQSAIAEKVELSIPSVMKIVDELEAEGIVRKAGKGKSIGGKRPDMIEIVAESYYAIGVDMGRTTIRISVCNLQGDICNCTAMATGDSTPEDLLVDRVVKLIYDTVVSSQIPTEKILGIGIAMPGLIEENTGNVILSPDFSWENVQLQDMLYSRLNLPIRIENANLSLARAEARRGAGKGSNFLLCVNIGHGIGAGLLLGGHPYKGTSGTAGELGHMTVESNGPLCSCGNHGCLEAVASGEAIRQQAIRILQRGIPSAMIEVVQGDLAKIDAKIVFDSAAAHDSVAQSIISRAAEYLGIALANCINLLDPDCIVLCGGITRNGEWFIQQIKNHIDYRRMRGSGRSVKIRTGMLDEYAVSYGATLHYIDSFFSSGAYGYGAN